MTGIRLASLYVPSYTGMLSWFGVLFSSACPGIACFTAMGLGGMVELCFMALVASQRKSVPWLHLRENQARDPEQGTLAWAAGSGVSQQWCLVLVPSRLQGFAQKPRDRSRVTVGTGSEWKDQPWGHRPASTVAGSSDHTCAAVCAGPRETQVHLCKHPPCSQFIPL